MWGVLTSFVFVRLFEKGVVTCLAEVFVLSFLLVSRSVVVGCVQPGACTWCSFSSLTFADTSSRCLRAPHSADTLILDSPEATHVGVEGALIGPRCLSG